MVLLVLAIAATLAAPAFARFGADQPPGGADAMLNLLRDARRAAIEFDADVTVRLDPTKLDYAVDTSGVDGSGMFARGVLDLGAAQSLVTDRPRLQYVFRPTGAAFADTVVVRGGRVPLVVRVDPWSGIARADSQ